MSYDRSTGKGTGDPLTRFLRMGGTTDWLACWKWQGGLMKKGYSRFRFSPSKVVQGHRYVYEQAYGPIPKDLVIDHLCRTRSCVNPLHLEAVTSQENTRRGKLAGGFNYPRAKRGPYRKKIV